MASIFYSYTKILGPWINGDKRYNGSNKIEGSFSHGTICRETGGEGGQPAFHMIVRDPCCFSLSIPPERFSLF